MGYPYNRVEGAAAVAGGGVAMIGAFNVGKTEKTGLHVRNSAGKLMWFTSRPARPVDVAASGDLVAILYDTPLGNKHRWTYDAYDAKTGARVFATMPGTYGSHEGGAICQLGADRFVIAHHGSSAGPAHLRLLEKTGQARRDTPSIGNKTRVHAMASAGKGAMFVGTNTGLGGRIGVFGLLDENGSLRLRVPLADGSTSELHGVAVLDKGGAAAAGWRTSGGRRTPLLTVHSGLGFARCNGLGKCSSKTLKSCDDGSACTLDGCSPTTGCDHVPLDSNVCDAKDGCSGLVSARPAAARPHPTDCSTTTGTLGATSSAAHMTRFG